jgi:hypothetical protein
VFLETYTNNIVNPSSNETIQYSNDGNGGVFYLSGGYTKLYEVQLLYNVALVRSFVLFFQSLFAIVFNLMSGKEKQRHFL